MKATEEYFSCGAVYHALQGGCNVWVCGFNPEVWPSNQIKVIYHYFPVVLLQGGSLLPGA